MKIRDDFPFLLNEEGLTGIGVELGVQKAEYSEHFLKNWNGKELILIDIWREVSRESYNDVANVPQDAQRENLSSAFDRIYPFGEKATIIRATGERAVNLFLDNSLDFVYIDANHGYSAVVRDLGVWYHKVKKGGYLCGHDYPFHEVKKAVDEFCSSNGFSMFISTDDWSSFFIKKP
jgi:hypothetical protein